MIDTDVFVDHLRAIKALRREFRDFPYSIVTRCELYAGSAVREDRVRRLLAPMRQLDIDRSIAERAGRLRRSAQIAIPDALIAATALEHDLPLLTRNPRHFSRVPGLEIINP